MNEPPQAPQSHTNPQPGYYPSYPPPKQGMSSGLKVALIVICVLVGIPVLLVVIGAVGLVFWGAGGGKVSDSHDRANWDKARAEMGEIQKSLSIHALNNDGEYPDSLDQLGKDFNGKVPRDPFTKDHYIYKKTDSGFELTCLGRDQIEGGITPPDQDIRYTERGEDTAEGR